MTSCPPLTQLTADVPVKLRVEIRGVDAIGRRIDARQLPLVKNQEPFGFVMDQRLSSGLTKGQNVSWSS